MERIPNFARPPNLMTREADHRIANSLASISALIRTKAGNPRIEASVGHVRQVLLDVSGRIDMVARLHRLLASSRSEDVPVAQLLRDVCEAMRSIVLDDGQVKATVECSDDLTLRPEASAPLGLLAAELFSNSVKYAHPTGLPTIIRIGFSQAHDGMLTFVFEDDGVGLPESFDPAHEGSVGMRVVRGLSNQLRAQCQWQDTGIGLRYICRFPA